MTSNSIHLLVQIMGGITWLNLAPFAVMLPLRRRALKGSRLWHIANTVIVTLRPTIKPTVVLWFSFWLLSQMIDPWHWYTPLLILCYLVLLKIWWKIADEDKDDDEGGPWNAAKAAIKKRTRNLVPARLAHGGAR